MVKKRSRAWRLPRPVAPLAGSIVVLLLSLICTIVRIGVPSDGGSHYDSGPFHDLGVVVDPPDPLSTPLRQGMVVEAVEGVAVDELLGGARLKLGAGPITYRVLDGERVRDVEVVLHDVPVGPASGPARPLLIVGSLILALAMYVLNARPKEPAAVALFCLGAGLASAGASTVLGWEVSDIAARPALFAAGRAVGYGSFISIVYGVCLFALTYPREPAMVVRRPWLLSAGYLWLLVALVPEPVMVLAGAATTRRLRLLYDIGPIVILPIVVAAAVAVGGTLWRSRRDRAVRRDVGLLAGGACASLFLFGAVNVSGSILDVAYPEPVYLLALLPLPVAASYGVLRRGAFELRSLVGRSLTYAIVVVVLVSLYVVAVASLQRAFRVGDFAASIPAAAAVAVGFAPLLTAVQRKVERVLYGARRDPYVVLADVGHEVQASADPVDALERLVGALADALRLPWVAVVTSESEVVASVGERRPDLVTSPLVHQGNVLGTLEVSTRSVGDAFTDAELQLLRAVAAQAATAADAVRLTDALARSRARALAASEDERKRIRRDLHDGLGPMLTGIGLQLSAAKDRISGHADAGSFVTKAAESVEAAKVEVRRVIDGMHPAELERLGLMAALRHLGDRLNGAGHGPVVGVQGPLVLPAVAPEVEVGAYRIAAEAIVNACKHSGGTRCDVDVAVSDGWLVVTVLDDGGGMNGARPGGVGLASMRDRAESLGGEIHLEPGHTGTTVQARLPVEGQEK